MFRSGVGKIESDRFDRIGKIDPIFLRGPPIRSNFFKNRSDRLKLHCFKSFGDFKQISKKKTLQNVATNTNINNLKFYNIIESL